MRLKFSDPLLKVNVTLSTISIFIAAVQFCDVYADMVFDVGDVFGGEVHGGHWRFFFFLAHLLCISDNLSFLNLLKNYVKQSSKNLY